MARWVTSEVRRVPGVVATAAMALFGALGGCGGDESSTRGTGGAGAAGAAQTGGSSAGGSDSGGTAAAAGTTSSGGSTGTGGAPGTGGVGGEPGDDCGGCDAGQLCIYQAGGPGPSRWLCTAGAVCPQPCACIEGQGGCTFVPRDMLPGYCSCDNGLE